MKVKEQEKLLYGDRNTVGDPSGMRSTTWDGA